MDTTNTRPDRADRIGLYVAIAWVAIGAILAIVASVGRLTEVAPGQDIPVLVSLADEPAALPLAPDGAPFPVEVATATVVVADPGPGTLAALWAQPIWFAVMVSAAMVLSAMFFLRLARGRAFTRGAARIAFLGAGLVVANWLVESFLGAVVTLGALSAISDGTYENWTVELGFTPVGAVLILAATGAALRIGERLQRETEGLV